MKTPCRTALLFLLASGSLSAQTTLLTWAESGFVNTATPITGVSGTTFIGGSGVNVTYSDPIRFSIVSGNPSSLATAELDNTYVEFSLAASSALVELSSLSIAYDGATAGPQQLNILVSVDGGAYVDVFHDGSVSASAEQNPGIDLSGLSSINSGATFRIYLYNGSSGNHLDLVNLSSENFAVGLQGTVSAVPEPATSALWAAAGALMVVALRRRRLGRAKTA